METNATIISHPVVVNENIKHGGTKVMKSPESLEQETYTVVVLYWSLSPHQLDESAHTHIPFVLSLWN